jgi:hypothetical protein
MSRIRFLMGTAIGVLCTLAFMFILEICLAVFLSNPNDVLHVYSGIFLTVFILFAFLAG